MKMKEFESEAHMIFDHKIALTEKIDFNVKLSDKYAEASKTETNPLLKREYSQEATRGRKHVVFQKQERNKLSCRLIAKQLGVETSRIKYMFRQYVGSPL